MVAEAEVRERSEAKMLNPLISLLAVLHMSCLPSDVFAGCVFQHVEYLTDCGYVLQDLKSLICLFIFYVPGCEVSELFVHVCCWMDVSVICGVT